MNYAAVYRHIIYIWFPYLAASRIQREIGMALPLVVIKNIRELILWRLAVPRLQPTALLPV